MSSGNRVGRSALVMLLVTLGAAVEVYDIKPEDAEPDMAYQEDNDIDTGAFGRPEPHQPFVGDVLLNRLLNVLAHDRPSLQFRPNIRDTPEALEQDIPIDIKAVFKRLPTPLRSHQIRPQQKWKIKKGKTLGPRIVCYFKLCSFRSPH